MKQTLRSRCGANDGELRQHNGRSGSILDFSITPFVHPDPYPYEVRNEAEYFADIQDVKVIKDMLDLAQHIVEQKSAAFEPEKFEDRYEAALTDLINQKRAGRAIETKARPRGDNVVDLMDALRKSLNTRDAAATKVAKPKKKRKAAPGQREMLLPIVGKGQGAAAKAKAPEQAKKPAKAGSRQQRVG